MIIARVRNALSSAIGWVRSLGSRSGSQLPPASGNASVELLTVGKVLPVLSRQLDAVDDDMRSSVEGVCEGFGGMTQRAQSALQAAQSAIGATDGEENNMISAMQEVVQSLITHIGESCEFSRTAAERLTQIEHRLEGVELTLRDIEEIAHRAKLVALNGQIEAARLGESGVAFEVVASETKELSRHAGETSIAIRALVGQLVIDIKDTSGELRRREEDSERMRETQDEAVNLLDNINTSHERMTKSLGATTEISQLLSQDIGRAVMSMQFQDRVSQRVAHVTETLQMLVERIESANSGAYESIANDRCDAIMSEVSSRYTMDSERVTADDEVFAEEEPVGAACDVELF